jgi:hypothetical protein
MWTWLLLFQWVCTRRFGLVQSILHHISLNYNLFSRWYIGGKLLILSLISNHSLIPLLLMTIKASWTGSVVYLWGVSEWLLLSAKWAIFQQYYGGNKLHVIAIMMMSLWSTVVYILAHHGWRHHLLCNCCLDLNIWLSIKLIKTYLMLSIFSDLTSCSNYRPIEFAWVDFGAVTE